MSAVYFKGECLQLCVCGFVTVVYCVCVWDGYVWLDFWWVSLMWVLLRVRFGRILSRERLRRSLHKALFGRILPRQLHVLAHRASSLALALLALSLALPLLLLSTTTSVTEHQRGTADQFFGRLSCFFFFFVLRVDVPVHPG